MCTNTTSTSEACLQEVAGRLSDLEYQAKMQRASSAPRLPGGMLHWHACGPDAQAELHSRCPPRAP